MPSPDDVFTELEEARGRREREVRLLQNLAALEQDDGVKSALRRSLVLVAYAHLEGFCKAAMDLYATTLNSMKLPCSEAIAPLVAATLHRAFWALRDVNVKHPMFPKLQDDLALHMTWREQRFAESVTAMLATPIDIPDDAIDTESNLKPDVLKRNMYKLGLDFATVEAERSSIQMLLGKRNEIAHGELTEATPESVEEYVGSAFRVMQFVQGEIYKALNEGTYRKPAAA